MEGSLFDELEFFAGAQDEKPVQNCMPAVSSSSQLPNSTDRLNQGIYVNEESIDFSSILDSCNPTFSSESVPFASSGTPASTVTASVSTTGNPVPTVSETVTSSTAYQSFQSYLPTTDLTLVQQNMYGSSENAFVSSLSGHVEMTPSPPSLGVECIGVPPTPSPHVVQIDSSISTGNFTALRPAPGKAQRPGKQKKHSVDKNSTEYRQKRDRNNVAVRKSREKSKLRVLDTEKRVKDLEEENTQLQSKIALLTKELNVLKSLFTSAGVSQPPSFHSVKDEAGRGRN